MYLGSSVFLGYLLASAEVDHLQNNVTENILKRTNMSNFNEEAAYENVILESNEIHLRSVDGEGSVVRMHDPIRLNDWSLETVIDNIKLRDIQKAGVYFWFTGESIAKGSYKGGSGKFEGVMFGIEFMKNKYDLVFSYNMGMDYTGKEEMTIKTDHINPDLISDVRSIRMKIIHTANNFKVELYDEDTILFDTFRINERVIQDIESRGIKIGITTVYEHRPAEMIKMKSLSLFERTEGPGYNSTDYHTPANTHPRNMADEEVLHAIASMDHFTKYLVHVLGEPGNKSRIAEITVELRNRLRDGLGILDEVLSRETQNLKTRDFEPFADSQKKLGEFNRKMNEIQVSLDGYYQLLSEIAAEKEYGIKDTCIFLVALALGFILVKRCLEKFIIDKKATKRE